MPLIKEAKESHTSKIAHRIPIHYCGGEEKYLQFAPLLEQDWSMLLDSGSHADQEFDPNQANRFDILVSEPLAKLSFADGTSYLETSDGLYSSEESPLKLMENFLQDYLVDQAAEINQFEDIPFNGGWLGYLSYDWSKEMAFKQANLETIAKPSPTRANPSAPSDSQVKPLQIGFYPWALISDHQQKTSYLYNFALDSKSWQKLSARLIKQLNKSHDITLATDPFKGFRLTQAFKSNLSFNEYRQAFDKIKNHIQQGDCYQINFTQEFSASFAGDPYEIYHYLAKQNNAPFSAYLNFGEQQILSLSPERFIHSHKGRVCTQPIKGTMPRSQDPRQDLANAEQLKNSLKDRAENLMIVDLMRNDLSKTAAKGSVTVSKLFELNAFKSVFHLISTIESQIDPKYRIDQLLETCLPGGSITGAPKLRAMQIIEQLEPHQRGIYCGNILYLDFNLHLDSNICIRTLVASNEQLYCWAGGGIVADSDCQQEYQEALAKLAKIIPPLEASLNASQSSHGNN